VSIENQCSYCVAGHSAFAEMQHVSPEIIDTLQHNQSVADSKLEALNQFTRLLVHNKGMISDQEIQQFLDVGYTAAHVIEIILGVCVKTFSNLANNLIGIPLDDEFSQHAWQSLLVFRLSRRPSPARRPYPHHHYIDTCNKDDTKYNQCNF
jgi:type I site-specific restriction endonuclease